MGDPIQNKELRLHRLHNQRRIAFSLIERSRTLLIPGTPFTRELHEMFRAQGKFGSKDRRLYRELIYTYLRFQPWLDERRHDQAAFIDNLIKLAAPTPEILTLYPTLADRPTPESLQEPRFKQFGRETHQLGELLPTWFDAHTTRSVSNCTLLTLFTRPPLWLRIQKDPRGDVISQLRSSASPLQAAKISSHPLIPDCIHAPADYPLANHPCYENGLVEIQDISSQILLHLLRDPPKGKWLDACAGAGGKTLQLANLLKPYGTVAAYDPRSSALRELSSRAKRSGLTNISVLKDRPTSGTYDGVLIDAPCSGSGTWRRHPYLMRQTREQDVLEYAKTQLSIIKSYLPLVNVGGRLVYSTCSLSRYENEAVAARFLEAHPDFKHEPLSPRFGLQDKGNGITVYPEDHDGDGLYVTVFKRLS